MGWAVQLFDISLLPSQIQFLKKHSLNQANNQPTFIRASTGLDLQLVNGNFTVDIVALRPQRSQQNDLERQHSFTWTQRTLHQKQCSLRSLNYTPCGIIKRWRHQSGQEVSVIRENVSIWIFVKRRIWNGRLVEVIIFSNSCCSSVYIEGCGGSVIM